MQVNTPHISISGITHPGLIRPENEDSILIDEKGNFMLLADGMGGHDFGAVASRVTLRIIRESFSKKTIFTNGNVNSEGDSAQSNIDKLLLAVNNAVAEANSILFERNRKARLKQFMGTTLVGLIPVPKTKQVLWFHVGDSRLYRWRAKDLKCLTVDHSAYEEWLRGGQAGKKPGKNLITRAVGTKDAVAVDIGWDEQINGDVYMLCSDGLNDMISEERIIGILASGEKVNDIAQHLIDAAIEAGGRDNVSVVVCRV